MTNYSDIIEHRNRVRALRATGQTPQRNGYQPKAHMSDPSANQHKFLMRLLYDSRAAVAWRNSFFDTLNGRREYIRLTNAMIRLVNIRRKVRAVTPAEMSQIDDAGLPLAHPIAEVSALLAEPRARSIFQEEGFED